MYLGHVSLIRVESTPQPEPLSREQVRAILLRNPKSMTRLAGKLNRSKSLISVVLSGRGVSEPVMKAAEKLARTLLKREKFRCGR